MSSLSSCFVLSCLVQTWRRHPDTLVGFFPRSHSHNEHPNHQQLIGQQQEEEEGGGGGVWEYLYFWRYRVAVLVVGLDFSGFCCVFFTADKNLLLSMPYQHATPTWKLLRSRAYRYNSLSHCHVSRSPPPRLVVVHPAMIYVNLPYDVYDGKGRVTHVPTR